MIWRHFLRSEFLKEEPKTGILVHMTYQEIAFKRKRLRKTDRVRKEDAVM